MDQRPNEEKKDLTTARKADSDDKMSHLIFQVLLNLEPAGGWILAKYKVVYFVSYFVTFYLIRCIKKLINTL